MAYGETFKFLRPSEVMPEAGETVCRTGSLGSFAALFIVLPMALAPFYIWWNEDPMWIFDIVLGLWVAFFALILFVIYRTATASLGRKNWLMRIRSDGVMIKFRSYLNAEAEVDDETVIFIHFREIARADVLKEKQILPNQETGADVLQGVQKLDLVLYAPENAVLLADRVAAEHTRVKTESRARGQFLHWPVSVINGNVIRLIWRGRSDRISPGIDRVMKQLSRRLRTSVADGGEVELVNLPPEARDAHIRELVNRGERITAVKVVRESMGMGMTEAIMHVDAVMRKDPDPDAGVASDRDGDAPPEPA